MAPLTASCMATCTMARTRVPWRGLAYPLSTVIAVIAFSFHSLTTVPFGVGGRALASGLKVAHMSVTAVANRSAPQMPGGLPFLAPRRAVLFVSGSFVAD